MPSPAPDRRRFRFSLRTLFVLVTVLGSSLGWLGMQLRWIRERHDGSRWSTRNIARPVLLLQDADAPWSLRLFGESGFKAAYVIVQDERNPTSDDERLRRQVESVCPEAKVGYMSSKFRESMNAPVTSRAKRP